LNHLQTYSPRKVLRLPTGNANGWQLKMYGIIAENKKLNSASVNSALNAAIERLPKAGSLDDPSGNHGVGFQIVHFAEVAVVSPVFYWIWGSVLASTDQMRAPWGDSANFETGVTEVVGCVWEMQIMCFETQSWKQKMLSGVGTPEQNVARYIDSCMPLAEAVS